MIRPSGGNVFQHLVRGIALFSVTGEAMRRGTATSRLSRSAIIRASASEPPPSPQELPLGPGDGRSEISPDNLPCPYLRARTDPDTTYTNDKLVTIMSNDRIGGLVQTVFLGPARAHMKNNGGTIDQNQLGKGARHKASWLQYKDLVKALVEKYKEAGRVPWKEIYGLRREALILNEGDAVAWGLSLGELTVLAEMVDPEYKGLPINALMAIIQEEDLELPEPNPKVGPQVTFLGALARGARIVVGQYSVSKPQPDQFTAPLEASNLYQRFSNEAIIKADIRKNHEGSTFLQQFWGIFSPGLIRLRLFGQGENVVQGYLKEVYRGHGHALDDEAEAAGLRVAGRAKLESLEKVADAAWEVAPHITIEGTADEILNSLKDTTREKLQQQRKPWFG